MKKGNSFGSNGSAKNALDKMLNLYNDLKINKTSNLRKPGQNQQQIKQSSGKQKKYLKNNSFYCLLFQSNFFLFRCHSRSKQFRWRFSAAA